MAGIRWLGATLGVAALYFVCARIGLMLALPGTNATPVWPPAGIALALVLLAGQRMILGVFLGAFSANLFQAYWVNQIGALPWALGAAFGVALGNTSETLLVAFLVQRFCQESPFLSLRGALVYAGSSMAGCALAALIALLTLPGIGTTPAFAVHFFLTWWLGDLAALMILTPLLLHAGRMTRLHWSPARLAHLFLFATLFMLALNLWFSAGIRAALPVSPLLLLLPLLVWMALAFHPREVSLMLMACAVLALYLTLSGSPVFAGQALPLSLLSLQAMLCVVAGTVQAINGAVLERRWLQRKLASLKQRLEQSVQERMQALAQANRVLQERMQALARSEKRLQDSEDRLTLITQATTDGIWEWEASSRHFRHSSRFKSLLGFDQFDLLPQSLRFWLRRMALEDRRVLLRACVEHLRQRTPLNVSFRLRNKGGQVRWYRVQGQAIWDEKGQPVRLAGSISDVDAERIAHDLLLNEKRLLERMTSGARLADVLQQAAELLCARFLDAGCVMVLRDETGVNPQRVAQYRMEPRLLDLLAGIKVGSHGVGTSAAIYFNTPLIVDDVQQHPDWRPFLLLVRGTALRACWSLPIRNRHGSVLGALALFFPRPASPGVEASEFLDRVTRLLGIAVEQDETRAVLQDSEQRYRELYHNNPAMFFSLDREGIICSVNQFGAEHLGYTPAQLVGRHYRDLLEEPARPELATALRQALESPGRVQAFEARKYGADGHALWVRDTLRAMGTSQDKAEVLVVAEDITDIHELSDRLAYHAAHDPLTGLINRRQFETELVNALQEAASQGRTHALCYLDLDLFKIINDTCGHAAGDELLRQLGRLLEQTVDGQGQIARLGGDEFGLLIRDCSRETVLHLAGQVRDRIAGHPFVWNQRPYPVGVSIGIVEIGQDNASLTQVMSAADSACYAAKESGRNRIQVYHPDDRALEQRRGEMQWVTRIPRGIRDDRFALAMQDILALDPRQTERHVEVLLRYRRQDGQWILPRLFLPAAERYSMATLLDRWVFVQLAQRLQQQPQLLAQGWVFNLNLSGQSVSNAEFLQFLAERITSLGLPGHHLCFEITETAAITHLSSVRPFIERLKALGCRFALDDFGSGLSSFGYLKSLPVDYLKIDGQFVRDMETDAMDFAIVKSISEVGHALGKQVVAEWVESPAMLARLREIGVDWAQGYGLATPVPLAEWLTRATAVVVPHTSMG